jgi:histidinol-phosphatase
MRGEVRWSITGKAAVLPGGNPRKLSGSGFDWDRAAGAPVGAVGGAGEQILVDEVTAQRCVVVVDGLEDLVDSEFLVAATGLEGLRDLVEQEQPGRALGRDGRDPAVPHKRAELPGQEVTVEIHPGDYAPGRPPEHGRNGLSTRQWDSAACTVSQVGSYDDDLRFAHVLADAADDITTKRFRALDLRVETKPDLTPVSDADRATEDSLRNILRRSRPRDAVLGEESGQTGKGPRRWVLDPIDATKNYVRGVPVWATLIGLMDGDDVVVGVVTAPALGRRWWAGVGGGAWTGRSLTKASRCQVSQVTKLSDASFSYSGIGGWGETGRLDGFLSLSRAVWRTRGFGDFWSHMLVAEGAVDVSAEPEVSLWDLAALQVIVEEAGGRFTSLSGVASPDGGSVVCTNGHLHDEVLAHLADSSEQ